MRRVFSLCIAAALACMASPCLADASILLMGDSLAIGLCRPLLAASRQVKCDARGGTRLGQWLNNGWAKEDLTHFEPSIVLISLGTNDFGQVERERFESRVAKMNALVRSHDAEPIWLMPPTMPFDMTQIWNGIMAYNGRDNVIDVRCMKIPRQSDRVHPTWSGYKDWAGQIWRQLVTNNEPCGQR